MVERLKARTPLLALILAVFGLGYTFAQSNNVVVVPLGDGSDIGVAKAAAAVFCGTSATVHFDFNRVTNADVTIGGVGDTGGCLLDFGFDLKNSYVSVSQVKSVDVSFEASAVVRCFVDPDDSSGETLGCIIRKLSDGSLLDASIHVIVY